MTEVREKRKLEEQALHNRNRKIPIDPDQLFVFPIPLANANERRETKLPVLRNYTLYFTPLSLSLAFSLSLGSSQVFHSLTWLVDVAEQNFRYDEPGQQAHQQKHPLHCKQNENPCLLRPPLPLVQIYLDSPL